MAPRLDVKIGPLFDHATSLEAQAVELDQTLKKLGVGLDALRSTTSGEASDAAVAATERVIAETTQRKDQLDGIAKTIRNVAEVYDSCDLAGARALGE